MLLQIIPLLLLFRVKKGNRINLFTYACLSSRLSKIVSLQSFFTIFVVFSNCFKSFLKIRQRKRSLKGRRRINRRQKWWTSFWRPKLQRPNICKILLLFLSLFFISLNFCNVSVDCLCNFSTKFSSPFILEIENDINLFEKNEKEEELYCLPPSKT